MLKTPVKIVERVLLGVLAFICYQFLYGHVKSSNVHYQPSLFI